MKTSSPQPPAQTYPTSFSKNLPESNAHLACKAQSSMNIGTNALSLLLDGVGEDDSRRCDV